MKIANNNIGLFGSSFNPPHQGHLAVLQDLLEKNLFDEIWLIPVFSHPFSKELAPYKTRLELVKLLCEDLPKEKIKISTIERDLNQTPSYTYVVVKALKQLFPDYQFTIILGTDAKLELPKWHRYADLKKEASFYFIPRLGYENSPYPAVSSSQIRQYLKQGKPINSMTTSKIANFLIKNKVYQSPTLDILKDKTK